MSRFFLPLALALATDVIGISAQRAPTHLRRIPEPPVVGAAPRAVVREATRAVERDSAAALRARWEAWVRADSTDRAAALGLATLARLTYDYSASERLYRRLFAATRPQVGPRAAPDDYAVYARLGWASALEDRGLSDSAGSEFALARAAAHATGDRVAEAEALLGLSLSRGRAEGMAAGLVLLDTAGVLIPDTALALQARYRSRRAMVLATLSRPDAMAEAEAGLTLARRAGDRRAEGHALRAISRVLWSHGETDSAMVFARQAEQLFRRAGDRVWIGVAYTDRANSLLARGDAGDAKEACRLALAEGEATQSLWTVATAHICFGAIAAGVFDLTTATRHLNRALAMFAEQGNLNSAMRARSWLASVAIAAGNLDAARQQVLEVLKYYQKVEQPADQLVEYRKLAAIAMRERDWRAAERWLGESHALARRLRQPLWDKDLVYDDGRLALLRGELAAAERSFASYLATLDTSRHVDRYDSRLRLAHIYARRGNVARAEREASSAWDELDHWRASLSDRELRVLAFEESPDELQASPPEQNDQAASVAWVLALLARGGRTETAFTLAEGRRARELSDRLARAAVLRIDSGAPHAAASPVVRRNQRVSAAEIVAAIPDDRTAVLEYVVGAQGAPTTVFTLTRAGARAHVVPPLDSLAARVGRLSSLVEGGADARALARALGAALLDSALAALPSTVTRLVIVPDGPLHRVPWDVLRMSDGRSALERYAIALTPSAAVLTALWQRGRDHERQAAHPVRLLAFGDPAFTGRSAGRASAASGDAAEETYRSAFDSAGGLPRLPASGREARLVARYAPEADVRLGERASAAFLKRAPLRGYRVIHFATHALVDDRSAARSALALAPGGGESGFVGPGDLAALELDADLVVLSACRSAGGVVVRGEGVQGLTAPLLQAGARSVVASQWRVRDRSTVPFATAFYGALARGQPVADALRSAKLDAIRRGRPPSEWAAFTAVGDPLVAIPLRAPPPVTPWVAALVTLALAAGGAATYARRRRGVPA